MNAETMRQVIDGIIGKIEKGDLVAGISGSMPVSFENDRLKSIEDNSRFAVGLRLFENGRVGNAFINSTDDIDVLIDNARASAQIGDVLDIELPANSDIPELKTCFDETINLTKDEALRWGEEAVKVLKDIDDRAKIFVDIDKSCSRDFLANTSGFKGEKEESLLRFSAVMNLVEDDGSILEVGKDEVSYLPDIDREAIYRDIEWRYKHAQKRVAMESGYFPVIFAPEAVDTILAPLEISANGKNLYKGISALADKIDEKIASGCLTIIDDPFYERGIGSYAFDDEGVIPKPMPIIENGVFKNFVFDLTSAKRVGKSTTGHASRGISSMPSPSFSNLVFSKGDAGLEELIGSVDYGLLVYHTLGGGMSNIIAGDISVNVELAFLIEKGKVKGRVKDVMISGNSFDFMKSIRGMENKLHNLGDLFVPHILVGNVSVSA
jgi:PmbA protein